MKYTASLLIALSVVLSRAETRPASCPALSTSARGKLVSWVQRKYLVPPATQLQIQELSKLTGCYRKVRFSSAESKGNFRMDLFVSPDGRYLSKELFDSTSDPVEEARRNEEVLAAQLRAATNASKGVPTAPVSVTVFPDFQCPYCQSFAQMLNQGILPITAQNVYVTFRHFPLPSHAWALPAAQAAACAGLQSNDAFWALHDKLFSRQKDITPENVIGKAVEYTRGVKGFDNKKFEACVKSKESEAIVSRDMKLAKEIGVNGTPTVYVGGRRVANLAGPEQLLTLIREETAKAGNSQHSGNDLKRNAVGGSLGN